jgi:threonylcarbamoyladenosine tRNA methylthiotransferase MtaB
LFFSKEYKKMKVSIQTLGCKVNQYETQAIELLLEQRGHVLVFGDEAADAYIVNSCTVTASSDKKSRQAVRQAKRKSPDALVALCGCYPQVSQKEAEALGVDLIAGTGNRENFVTLLEQAWDEKSKLISVDDAMKRRVFEQLPGGSLRERTRAMLKVEDGCTNFCAYCIIPYARGPVRSLPLHDTVQEARRLSEEGYREIVLTGIELSSWGKDWNSGETLSDLIEAVCHAAPGCRIRLGSLEPRTITEEFCERISKLYNLCPHFHLSLQSGCDETLRRMNRKYDTARYLESVNLLRKWFISPGITTDLIVGFPGETEDEFRQTLDLIGRCRFSGMHIFPYSPRKGTPAASMDGQLKNREKAERSKQAEKLAIEMEQAYLAAFIGRETQVLLEEEKDGFWRGHSGEYVLVFVRGNELHNHICRVRITEVGEGMLYGECVEEV